MGRGGLKGENTHIQPVVACAFFGSALPLFRSFHGVRLNIFHFQIFLTLSTLKRMDNACEKCNSSNNDQP